MRQTREAIVRDLEARGLRFHTFVIEEGSPHSIDEWNWNQHDLAHIPSIHSTFAYIPGAVDEDLTVGMLLQRIFGITIPIAGTQYHDTPDRRIWLETVGPFALVGSLELSPQGAGTRVVTTYSVGGPSPLHLLARASEWLIRRSYALVHREDEPLMERRTWLRTRGFTFGGDGKSRSYARSMGNGFDAVIPPPGAATRVHQIRVDDGQSEWLLGDADHLGLRVIRQGAALFVYPRLCLHQGASLDGAVPDPRGLRCPWHGRIVSSFAAFDLNEGAEAIRTTPRHHLVLIGGMLRVEPRHAGEEGTLDAASPKIGLRLAPPGQS